MSLLLDLPRELESELATEAARVGLPLSEYALRLISAGRRTRPTLRTGAELVDFWRSEGLVGTRTDIADSPVHARSVRHEAERRPRP